MSSMTLTRHLLGQANRIPNASDFVLVGERLSLAAKLIAHKLAAASLEGELGYTASVNVHGEEVKKLDNWANEAFLEAFAAGHPVCTLVSEEMAEPRHFQENCAGGGYAIFYDPIDGSSNTDVNGSLGTIFALRRRAPAHQHGNFADLLTAGTEQVAAGYVLYGPATMLVATFGTQVDAFTLDRSIGEFVLWQANIRMPSRGKTYAVNEANYDYWAPGARRLIDRLSGCGEGAHRYSLRYSGAFVADFHRCLLEGGIYLYPGEVASGARRRGKLRLMYEVAPLALLAERAGGGASTGTGRVLEVVPDDLHERVPVYIGSAEEVQLAEQMSAEGTATS